MGSFTKPGHEFRDVAIVRQHARAASEMVARDSAESFREEIDQRLDSDSSSTPGISLEFDSALEAVFWVWWMAARTVDRFCRDEIEVYAHEPVTALGNDYVIDFVIKPWRPERRPHVTNWPLIGIELDGHAFHERTPEQVARRDQRDRALHQAGWTIFHFSFSEFTQNPERCIWEPIEFAREIYGNLICRSAK